MKKIIKKLLNYWKNFKKELFEISKNCPNYTKF